MKKFLLLGFAVLLAAGFFGYRFWTARHLAIAGPDGAVRLDFIVRDGQLNYAVTFHQKPVIGISPVHLTVDGRDITAKIKLGRRHPYSRNERYPVRGGHSSAVDHCNGTTITVEQGSGFYTLEARVFDDAVAFRVIVPGAADAQRVPDESTVFTLPEHSVVWYHGLKGHYEGSYTQKDISDITDGDWAGPPVTVQLPDNAGYASITEAVLENYPGMALQADGNGGLITRLGHAQPVNTPFLHDYSQADATRLSKPAAVNGTITTPWRVVMVAADLNALVNCDVLTSLSPPPDDKLFPAGLNTDWIKPGRAVWCWLDGGVRTPEGMKEFSRMAGELGFEYNVVDAFWGDWTDEQIRDLVEYSKARKVGVWLWRHGRDVKNPAERRAFFKRCHDLGIVGVKLDAFSHESKEFIDLYQACYRDAAEFKLMLDIHGSDKPTGESRTWPNEMTREAIYGLEHRKSMTNSWALHNATLPFTRFLAGPGDYTPVIFGPGRNDTSWAHQVATAVVFTSPLLCYGANPRSILDNPAVDMIKRIPTTWDETIVLPPSEIGGLAVFARRNGNTWFLAILNGPTARDIQVPLKFLGAGSYETLTVADQPNDSAAVKMENLSCSSVDVLPVHLRAGGGYVARFVGQNNNLSTIQTQP